MLHLPGLVRRIGLIGAAVGYVVLAHYTNISQSTTLGMLVAIAPIFLACATFAWHSRARTLLLTLLAGGCALLLYRWQSLSQHYSDIYWAEHAGTELALCLAFAQTLLPGREPMVTRFARMVHGTLEPAMAHYTRQVTFAWIVFFAAMASLSTALYFGASLATWSMFANFFTAPLIGLMFLCEYLVRRWRFPGMEHAHIVDGVRAFWNAAGQQQP
jgi:uncharacterized membrane protein